jgi:hypothetical protein
MRSGNIYTSASLDEGSTWVSPEPRMFSKAGTGSTAYQLSSGAIALVFGSAYISPSPLVVALSYDGGYTWPYSRILQAQEEASYPAILQDDQGYIHIAYTLQPWLTIKYIRITELWIKNITHA